MAFYIRSDLLDLSEAFLRVSLKSQRSPDLTVLKIPQSHPDICQASVSPQCENLQPRASRRPSSLGLCADFLLCVWVLCFIRSLLFIVASFSSPLLRKCLNAHFLRESCFQLFFSLKKGIWGDRARSSSSLQWKFVWQIQRVSETCSVLTLLR